VLIGSAPEERVRAACAGRSRRSSGPEFDILKVITGAATLKVLEVKTPTLTQNSSKAPRIECKMSSSNTPMLAIECSLRSTALDQWLQT
jgi:hypothetical protein